MSESDYRRAERNCDIVMKGGITSGIVYPAAVCRLAREYRFRSIGGTSAGAIAAAATAAAEYGRVTGKGSSFSELERLPELLSAEVAPGAGSRLFRLFEPQPETRRLHGTLTAGIRGERGIGKLLSAAFRNYWAFGLLGALPGLLLAVLFHLVVAPFPSALAVLLAWFPWVFLAAVGASMGVARAILRDLRERVPANFYGLASGMGGSEALTPWLYGLLQSLAGKPNGEPLTFGDLWGADPARKQIDLQMMTTCITQERPYRLPFAENEEKLFYFRRADFERLFPAEVVEWMIARARTGSDSRVSEELLPLPLGRDLPVIVAARMSLSFPFLISAVPLQAIDFTRGASHPTPEPCWFSDGGIASNFPVHFFDAPLPGWPTFAINLRYYEETPPANVVMPERNVDGIADVFRRFEKAGLVGFFKAIFDAMQNWQDNAQAKMPGFRDRIVHVSLGPGEGGLNLDMPERTVKEIAERGDEAAELLLSRFAPDSTATLDWDNHRWVRFRSTMAALEEMLEKLGPRLAPDFEPPQPGDENYRALLARESEALPSYPWTSGRQREEATRAVKELEEIAARWAEASPKLAAGAPRPMPELRARPRI
ncbi:MAG: patatin-like phospholipase family protein [Vicinamibacteria bacterium]